MRKYFLAQIESRDHFLHLLSNSGTVEGGVYELTLNARWRNDGGFLKGFLNCRVENRIHFKSV